MDLSASANCIDSMQHKNSAEIDSYQVSGHRVKPNQSQSDHKWHNTPVLFEPSVGANGRDMEAHWPVRPQGAERNPGRRRNIKKVAESSPGTAEERR